MTSEDGERRSHLERRLREAMRLSEEIRAQSPPEPDESDTGSGSPEPEEDSATALAAVRLRLEKLKAKNQKQDLRLRKQLARNATRFVALQLLASNVFFGVYLAYNASNPSSQVMVAWLASSVIEVIGILAVIARSLFPVPKSSRKDKDGKSKNE